MGCTLHPYRWACECTRHAWTVGGCLHPLSALRKITLILKQNKATGFWTDTDNPAVKLRKVHSEIFCQDRGCAIHNHPSEHPLNNSPLNWRTDRGILERICVHGIGHPDADSASWLRSQGLAAENIHGCDFCCVTVL